MLETVGDILDPKMGHVIYRRLVYSPILFYFESSAHKERNLHFIVY